MKLLKKSLIALGTLAAVSLAGCTGKYVTDEEIATFQEGVDTSTSVRAKLGNPQEIYTDGTDNLDLKHHFDIYLSTLDLIKFGNDHYRYFTIFAYTPEDKLDGAFKYYCLDDKECELAREAILSKYIQEDNQKILAKTQDKKKKRALRKKLKDEKKKQAARTQQLSQNKENVAIEKVSKPTATATSTTTEAVKQEAPKATPKKSAKKVVLD